MIFNEKNSIKVNQIGNIFIYFLVKDNEVVYVGQTRYGMNRPYQHRYDKEFDDIYIIKCDEDELDELEDKYIRKYTPIYNKSLNNKASYSLSKVRNLIKEIYPNFNLTKLKHIIKKLNINTYIFDNTIFIQSKDYDNILKYYKENL